jgi:7-carboxy-7-deazaguanine synthase
VVITGGETMIDDELAQLTRLLKDAGKHITIETAGIKYIPDVICDLMSISPKLSNSIPDDLDLAKIHADTKLDIAVLGELIDNFDYQLKFVIESPSDLAEVQQVLDQLENFDTLKVMLMPQAATAKELASKSEMVANLCLQTGYTFCQRLHVQLWNSQPGR